MVYLSFSHFFRFLKKEMMVDGCIPLKKFHGLLTSKPAIFGGAVTKFSVLLEISDALHIRQNVSVELSHTNNVIFQSRTLNFAGFALSTNRDIPKHYFLQNYPFYTFIYIIHIYPILKVPSDPEVKKAVIIALLCHQCAKNGNL